MKLVALAVSVVLVALAGQPAARPAAQPVYRIDHVSDGDIVAVRNGQRVRLVQIDTPEVFFGVECYGLLASRGQSICFHPAHGFAYSRSPSPTESISTGGCCAMSSAFATGST
jgi:hypothetical protein